MHDSTIALCGTSSIKTNRLQCIPSSLARVVTGAHQQWRIQGAGLPSAVQRGGPSEETKKHRLAFVFAERRKFIGRKNGSSTNCEVVAALTVASIVVYSSWRRLFWPQRDSICAGLACCPPPAPPRLLSDIWIMSNVTTTTGECCGYSHELCSYTRKL